MFGKQIVEIVVDCHFDGNERNGQSETVLERTVGAPLTLLFRNVTVTELEGPVTHSLTHSMTHSLTHSPKHSFTHKFTHSLIPTCTHSLNQLLFNSLRISNFL